MPGGDRTGPAGFGPMTGRAAGYCAGYSVPGYANPVGGRLGMGFRRGFGRGFGRGAFSGYPAYSPAAPAYPAYGANYPNEGNLDPKQEMDILQAEAEDIKAELDAVNKRLAELKKDKKE
ncbi:MAG: hypothetical protein XD76_1563 [candidate division TA06 bacterium 32_111]|jgi:hypothetical protein|nr:MAG: hypothetical protein XD76_1563 [candidate division TA06 bacterium 32_111]